MSLIEKMAGWKATDKNMCCRPDPDKPAMQYQLGVWYEVEGELVMCENCFHFCTSPSGVWNYYNSEGTRVFKVEAEGVVNPNKPGADNKCVARRIRLIEEVKIGGNMNTGDRNTGNMNTGNMNTGDRNTGDRNTGDRNTGQGNACDFSTGNFCIKTRFLVFDKPCRLTREKYYEKYGNLHYRLCELLSSDAKFDPDKFKELPNWSRKAVLNLHRTHIARRKATGK